jgi:hypothetical protein
MFFRNKCFSFAALSSVNGRFRPRTLRVFSSSGDQTLLLQLATFAPSILLVGRSNKPALEVRLFAALHKYYIAALNRVWTWFSVSRLLIQTTVGFSWLHDANSKRGFPNVA